MSTGLDIHEENSLFDLTASANSWAAATIPEPTEAFYVADLQVYCRRKPRSYRFKNIDLYGRTGAQIVVT